MADITIYHNPRCQKSREALAILNERPRSVEIVEYLKTPLNEKQVRDILDRLAVPAEELVRKDEAVYKSEYKDKNLSEEEWIRALVRNPILLQRPIVLKGNEGVIGRPPELVRELLD